MKIHIFNFSQKIPDRVFLVSLNENPSENTLRIVLSNKDKEYHIKFSSVIAYKSIPEEYGLMIAPKGEKIQSAVSLISDSPWIELLKSKEPLFEFHEQGNKVYHFIIVTEGSVVEILTRDNPTLEVKNFSSSSSSLVDCL